MSAPTLLVTGASGHLGRAVVRHLLDTLNIDPARVIATSRKPEALADLAAQGVTVRAADFDRPDTLAEAFRGADRLLVRQKGVARFGPFSREFESVREMTLAAPRSIRATGRSLVNMRVTSRVPAYIGQAAAWCARW